jgi:outer membrane lipoprotein-sorting protein
MKRFFLSFALLLTFVTLTFAQELSTQDIVAKLTERAETVEDVTFLMTGNLIDADGQEIPLEVTISSIPTEELLRAEFIQPDALADNFIVIDGQDVYNYVYLTNQVSIFSLGDREALADLFPSGTSESDRPFSFTLNLVTLFDGWTPSSQGMSENEAGTLYTLRFDNDEKGRAIGHVETTILEETWLPTTLDFYSPEDVLIAELVFNDLEVNTGLNADDLRYIDPSAEEIDER